MKGQGALHCPVPTNTHRYFSPCFFTPYFPNLSFIAAVNDDSDSILASLSLAQKEVARTAPWLGASQSTGVAAEHGPLIVASGSGSPSMV